MSQFKVVAMGGTFDVIHRGHISLLDAAFSASDKVIIGLTSDELVQEKGKQINNSYQKRYEKLKSLIEERFPKKQYEISRLENDFGPAVIEGNVEALVTSEETAYQGPILNKLRDQINLEPVKTIVVPLVKASDGSRISSTRIRNKEIDPEGNLV